MPTNQAQKINRGNSGQGQPKDDVKRKKLILLCVLSLVALLIIIFFTIPAFRSVMDKDKSDKVVLCSKCQFRELRTVDKYNLSQYKCRKCGAEIGLGLKCEKCGFEFTYMPPPPAPPGTPRKLGPDYLKLMSCPNCKSEKTYSLKLKK